MKIGCVIRSYGLTDYLPAVLKSCNWVDKILVMNHVFRGVVNTEDNTRDICQKFGIEVDSGSGLKQHEVLCRGIEKFKGFNWVFVLDSDELIATSDQKKIVNGMAHSNFEIGCVNIVDYAKDYDHIYFKRSHKPPVICTPKPHFFEVRCYDGGAKYFTDITLHHLGYLFSDDKLKWKFGWEKDQDKGALDIVGKLTMEYKMPDDIRRLLDE